VSRWKVTHAPHNKSAPISKIKERAGDSERVRLRVRAICTAIVAVQEYYATVCSVNCIDDRRN
jgi:hypothetical protein